jgi:outer membrane protein assembly factor BamB
LAVIVADGRFVWLNAQDGRLEAGAFLWSGLLEGDSWGEVYTDGMVAVVAAREMSISPQTGLADSRARLAVYDAGGNELWSLPELGAQHFYSAALAPGSVLVGKWPHGFDDNSLAAYELLTGQKLWEISDEQTGYQQIVHDGTRMYVLLNNLSGGAVVCYDLRTGEELWRWSDPTIQQPDLIVLANDSLYVQTVDRTLALDKIAGTVKWVAILQTAPEAGLAILGGLLYLAPAPAAELGFRPGVVGLRADNGELAWHSLSGLLADPLAVGGEAVWTIVKDYSSGQVWLSGLEPQTGLELIRLPIGNDPQTLYQLVASGRQVYILGNSLLAYGY